MVQFILFPGRHHLLTKFQSNYLKTLLESKDISSEAQIIFAVTSADHANTRRNPLPGHRREAMIESFAQYNRINHLTYLLDNVQQTDRFAEYIINSIHSQYGPLLTRDNTLLASSTPDISNLFAKLGFQNKAVELDGFSEATRETQRPWELVTSLAQNKEIAPDIEKSIDTSCLRFIKRYKLDQVIIDAFNDPALSDEGELTTNRNYQVYQQSFSESAQRKWQQLRPWIKPGKIVDIGCGNGALLQKLSHENALMESDLYGIEPAKPLFDLCLQDRRRGNFGNSNAFFYQRNFLSRPLFSDNSVNTFITVSLTHEINSYLGSSALARLAQLVYRQLAPGGRWINLDFCAPDDKDKPIWLEFENVQFDEEFTPLPLRNYPQYEQKKLLSHLDNSQLFQQFIHDWYNPGQIDTTYQVIRKSADTIIECSLALAMEWLLHKDYLTNWHNENQESFASYSLEEYKQLINGQGFHIHNASESWINQWLVENRFHSSFTLLPANKPAQQEPWPVTHGLLIADKPVLEIKPN